jgi:hypothetical protein
MRSEVTCDTLRVVLLTAAPHHQHDPGMGCCDRRGQASSLLALADLLLAVLLCLLPTAAPQHRADPGMGCCDSRGQAACAAAA